MMLDFLINVKFKTNFMDSKGFLGIDVSKGYADFLLIDSDLEILEESFQLRDNAADRKKLEGLFVAFFKFVFKVFPINLLSQKN